MIPEPPPHRLPSLPDDATTITRDRHAMDRISTLDSVILQPPFQPESPDIIPKHLERLAQNFGTYFDYPRPKNWDELDTENIEREYPEHPLTKRGARIQAIAALRLLALHHPESFDSAAFNALHRSLFDASAAVREDAAITIGILRHLNSRPWLTFAYAHEPESEEVRRSLVWAWMRIHKLPLETKSKNKPLPPNVAHMRVLRSIQLGMERVALLQDRRDEYLFFNEQSRSTFPASPLDANVFMNTNPRNIERFFFSQGGLDNTKASSPLAAVAAGLAHGLPTHEKLITLIDTTTLNQAVALVDNGRSDILALSPSPLFDLATLAYSAIMYDYIVVGDNVDTIPPELTSFVLPDKNHFQGAYDERYSFAVGSAYELTRHPELARALESAWQEFLGVQEVNLDYGHVDHTTTSPGVWSYEPGDGHWAPDPILALGLRLDRQQGSADEEVSIQTWRYFVNEKLAETLGVSYNSTSLRSPVISVSLRHRNEFRQYADDLLRRISTQPRGSDWIDEPYLPSVVLPNLLAVILKRARQPQDIWPQILELRENFRAVREKIQVARIEGMDDRDAIDDMVQQLTKTSSMLTHRIDGVVTRSAAIAGAVPGAPIIAQIALKIAATIPFFQKGERALELLTRPEIAVLRSFREEVAQVFQNSSDIERIWRTAPSRAWIDTAIRIANNTPLDSSKLRVRR